MGNVFVEENSLQDIANAIREKNGTDTKYLPSEMGGAVRDIQSGGMSPIDYISFYLNIENKEEWVVGEFTLLSDVTSGKITVENPIRKIPKAIIVFNKNIKDCIKKMREKNDLIVVGGINIGVTTDDNANNAMVVIKSAGVLYNDICDTWGIEVTNYNLINSDSLYPTETELYFRTGNTGVTRWYAGEYYVAVRA